MVISTPPSNNYPYLKSVATKEQQHSRGMIWLLKDISEHRNHDVLIGKPKGCTCRHPGQSQQQRSCGNICYGELIESKVSHFLRRYEKPGCHRNDSALALAACIVQAWRNQSPPGRFLKLNETNGLWYDVGNAFAVKKTSARVLALLQREENRDPEPEPLVTKEDEQTKGHELLQMDVQTKDVAKDLNCYNDLVLKADFSNYTQETDTSSSLKDCLACGSGSGIHPVQVSTETTEDGTECQASFAAGSSVSMTILLPHHSFLSICLLSCENVESTDSFEENDPQEDRNVETKVSFADCSAITSFDLPESRDMCIDAGAYRGCSSTVSVQIPLSKRPILDGTLSFNGSSSLKAVYQDVSRAVCYELFFRGQSTDVQLNVSAKISWTTNPFHQGDTHPDTKGCISISSMKKSRLI